MVTTWFGVKVRYIFGIDAGGNDIDPALEARGGEAFSQSARTDTGDESPLAD